jgi:hypothetical protein
MKYLLIVFGDFKGKTESTQSITETISIISAEDVKFTYGDTVMVINFYSDDDQEEVALYVNEVLRDLSTLYLLTPYTGNVFTSLPLDIQKHLFGMSEMGNDDNYETVDYVDLEPSPSIKKVKNITKNETKELTLDDILDKILSDGKDSLTEQDRLTLQKYSNK